MSGRPFKAVPFIISFVLICAGFAFAQNYSGTVVDNVTKAPVPGVFVSVGHSEFYTRTDANGRFSIENAILSAGPSMRPQQSKGQSINARWNFRRRTLDLSGAPGVTSAAIYSLNGKRIVNSKVPPSRIISLPALPMGVYMLELKGEGGLRSTGRVVLSNKNSSFTFRSMGSASGGSLPFVSESAQASSDIRQQLIFRHDNYLPVDMNVTGSRTDMSVSLRDDPRHVVFDQTKVHEYRFTVSSADWAYMENYGWQKEYRPATMSYNGAAIGGTVGLRYKGSDYSLPRCFNFDGVKAQGPKSCPKISFKVKFHEYDKDKRFHAMKRINLHAMNADPTKMRDMLAYELFREVGIHAPRTSYANVYVNNELIGLFVVVEDIDGRFTKSRWPNFGDGNLYKEIWPDKHNENDYIEALKTNDKPENNPQARRMVDYYNAIEASNESNFVRNLSSFMDFDHFLRYMTVDVAINNWDGIRGWYSSGPNDPWPWAGNHNFYIYEEENPDGKIWLVPWDMDNTFYEVCPYFETAGVPNWNVAPPRGCVGHMIWGDPTQHIRPPNCDKLTRMMAAVFWERYKLFGEQFLEDQFKSSRLAAKVEKYRQLISASVTADNSISTTDWGSNVSTGMDNHMSNLAAKFSNHLKSGTGSGGGSQNSTPNPNPARLSHAHLNDFEATSGGNLSWVDSYFSEGSTGSAVRNTSSPIAGNADLRFNFSLSEEGKWCNFQPEFQVPAPLSNLKEIRLTMRADRARTIRIAFGNWPVYSANIPGFEYGEYGWEGVSVTAEPAERTLSILNLRWPAWASPVGQDPGIRNLVLQSVQTLIFAIDGAFFGAGGENDDGFLQVDNIRFIYND